MTPINVYRQQSYLDLREDLNDEGAAFINNQSLFPESEPMSIAPDIRPRFEGTLTVIGGSESMYKMAITSELAGRWLKRNVNNRDLRLAKSDLWLEAMKRGEWNPSHQGICFDFNGVLMDGQHRLHALSRMPKDFMIFSYVCFNADPVSKNNMDITTVRSLSDRTGYRKKTSETISFLIQSVKKRPPTIHEAFSLYNSLKDALDWQEENWPTTKGICQVPIRAAFISLFQADRAMSEAVFKKLKTGAGMSSGDPILLLRNIAMLGRNGKSLKTNEMWNAARSAFKAVIEGRSMSKLVTVRK